MTRCFLQEQPSQGRNALRTHPQWDAGAELRLKSHEWRRGREEQQDGSNLLDYEKRGASDWGSHRARGGGDVKSTPVRRPRDRSRGRRGPFSARIR